MANLKVRAIQRGVYQNSIVEVGTEFELKTVIVNRIIPSTGKIGEVVLEPEHQFSSKWMELVEEEKKDIDIRVPFVEPEVNNQGSSTEEKTGNVIDHSGQDVDDKDNVSDDTTV